MLTMLTLLFGIVTLSCYKYTRTSSLKLSKIIHKSFSKETTPYYMAYAKQYGVISQAGSLCIFRFVFKMVQLHQPRSLLPS